MDTYRRLRDLCLNCGGKCCRCHTSIILSEFDDARRLESLGAEIVDDEDFGLTMLCPDRTCPFLKDGRCSIYEDRPAACIEFNCLDKRRKDSVVFEDFPEHAKAVKKALDFKDEKEYDASLKIKKESH
jgi:Fe-S-cluster containining protein